jgi:hypothetical protein
MTAIGTVDALFILLAFVVPGFVISFVRSQFATGRPQKGTDQVLGYLTLSAINYAVFSWLVYILVVTDVPQEHPLWAAFLWFVVILVGPALLGAGLGVAIQRDLFRPRLASLKLQPVHVVPTAWDYQFGRLREAHWVLVRLRDGGTVAGFFGPNSFASSDPEERDIFIEQLYRIDENQAWQRMKEGHGALITKDEVQSVEFWPIVGEQGTGGHGL